MDTYNTHPKRTVARLILNFDGTNWVTEAMIPKDTGGGLYSKVYFELERAAHPDFPSAMKFVGQNYVGRHS